MSEVRSVERLFRFNKRILIILFSGLMIIDLFIGSCIDRRFAEPACCRMPCDDPATVGLWIRQVEKAEGFKVVFLGDSVIHGLASGKEEQSLPAAVARSLKKKMPRRDVKVFNLALAGGGPAETLLILNALRGAKIDLVVYDLNIGWLGRATTLEHPNLLNLVDQRQDDLDLQGMGVPVVAQRKPVLVKSLAAESLLSRWKLYHYRILLNYWLFGKPVRAKLPFALHNPGILLTNREDAFPEIKELRVPWQKKEWPVVKNQSERLGAVSLSPADNQWKLYLKLIDSLKENGTRAVFFTPSRNFALLDKTRGIDYSGYRRNSGQMVEAARRNGFTVFQYDHFLGGNCFTDMLHPNAKGNDALAGKMVDDLISKGLIK